MSGVVLQGVALGQVVRNSDDGVEYVIIPLLGRCNDEDF